MKKNFIHFLLIIITFVNCNGQESSRQMHIIDSSTGFKMLLPEGFLKIDEKETEKTLQTGKTKFDELYKIDIDISGSKLNMFKKDNNNYFLLSVKDFDPKIDGNYETAVNETNNLLLSTYEKAFSSGKIDTSTSRIKIDNTDFYKFTISLQLTSKTNMKVLNYTSLINGKDFTMAVVYKSDEIGVEIKNAIEKTAVFKK